MNKKNSTTLHGGSQVPVEFTDRPITAWGGMAAILSRYLERLRFREWVELSVPVVESSNNAKEKIRCHVTHCFVFSNTYIEIIALRPAFRVSSHQPFRHFPSAWKDVVPTRAAPMNTNILCVKCLIPVTCDTWLRYPLMLRGIGKGLSEEF